jgi:hypothetical protein
MVWGKNTFYNTGPRKFILDLFCRSVLERLHGQVEHVFFAVQLFLVGMAKCFKPFTSVIYEFL